MPFRNLQEDKPNYASVLSVLSTLFFMWGLITVLNIMLINDFRNVFQLTYMEAIAMNILFFAAYFIMAVPAGKIIDSIGYRKGMMAGLGIAALGCFIAYPAAGMRSYPMFMSAIFIQACGVTMLQVAANPYVILIGPRGRGASKLTLVQAFNSLGAFMAPLFAQGLFMQLAGLKKDSFSSMSPEEIKTALVQYVQLPFLLMGILLAGLIVFVYFSKLPKLTTDSEPLVKDSEGAKKKVWQFPHLSMGAIAIFLYVGAEVTIGTHLAQAYEKLALYYWGAAMVGRFIGAAALTKISPRKSIGACSVFSSALVIFFMMVDSSVSVYAIVTVGLFNSMLFPCIFTMAIDGLGKYSEEGSAVLVMSIVGGAVMPFIVTSIASGKTGFIILVLAYLFIAFFGLKGSRYEKRTNFY